MTDTSLASAPPSPYTPPRCLGRFAPRDPRTAAAAPTLVVTSALHGNEPAGLMALRRVTRYLSEQQVPLLGHFVALSGNRGAYAHRKRFIEFDLNRGWTPEKIQLVRSQPRETIDHEYLELAELDDEFQRTTAVAPGRVFFMDIHTTSSDSAPFALVNDSFRNLQFAAGFPVPLLLGLSEQLDGALLEFVDRQGHTSLGFEGGSHNDPASVDHCESAIWMALVACGVLAEDQFPDYRRHHALLQSATEGLPRRVEVVYRHAITAQDRFQMIGKYRNLQRVSAGEIVAKDRRGDITIQRRGRILLPLYQGVGDEGFFLSRTLPASRMRWSRFCRALKLWRLFPLFPGVKRDPEDPRTLLIDREARKIFRRTVLHFFGYRQLRPIEDGGVRATHIP